MQGDSVYIGNNFVRKLSAEEQEKLVEFDQKFTSYQEAINNQIRQVYRGEYNTKNWNIKN